MSGTISDTVTLNNGVKMPRLGLGTWRASEGPEVERSVRWAIELGYRHIDTASIYGNERGVGRAIRECGASREHLFVTTKVWNDDQRAGYDAVVRAFDESLRRLAFDYVDLYLVHWPVKGRYEEAWRALEAIYARGRAKAIGVSNFLVHHLERLVQGANVVPAVNQVEFHPRLVQPELIDYCRRHGIVPEAWSPLMKGKVADIPQIRDLAKKHGKTPTQLVLRWNLQRGIVTIPKSVRRERLVENGDLFDFELTPEDLDAIDRLDRGERLGGAPGPLYVLARRPYRTIAPSGARSATILDRGARRVESRPVAASHALVQQRHRLRRHGPPVADAAARAVEAHAAAGHEPARDHVARR